MTKQYIYICKSYLESLWGGDITQPSTRFDNCGFTTYWLNSPHDSDVVLPSVYFPNVTSFINAVKPPFYEDYQMVIVDDENSNDPCFQGLAQWGLRTGLALLSIIILFY